MCGFFANDYERLVRCFEADWEFAAATYFRTFLDHAPISFSHCQSITRKDMIGVGLWCFATAPKEHGYPLVELLANESSKISLHLKSIPEGVSSVRIHPSEVEYLLEQTGEE